MSDISPFVGTSLVLQIATMTSHPAPATFPRRRATKVPQQMKLWSKVRRATTFSSFIFVVLVLPSFLALRAFTVQSYSVSVYVYSSLYFSCALHLGLSVCLSVFIYLVLFIPLSPFRSLFYSVPCVSPLLPFLCFSNLLFVYPCLCLGLGPFVASCFLLSLCCSIYASLPLSRFLSHSIAALFRSSLLSSLSFSMYLSRSACWPRILTSL